MGCLVLLLLKLSPSVIWLRSFTQGDTLLCPRLFWELHLSALTRLPQSVSTENFAYSLSWCFVLYQSKYVCIMYVCTYECICLSIYLSHGIYFFFYFGSLLLNKPIHSKWSTDVTDGSLNSIVCPLSYLSDPFLHSFAKSYFSVSFMSRTSLNIYCYGKSWQALQLKTAQIYCLTALQVESSTSQMASGLHFLMEILE